MRPPSMVPSRTPCGKWGGSAAIRDALLGKGRHQSWDLASVAGVATSISLNPVLLLSTLPAILVLLPPLTGD